MKAEKQAVDAAAKERAEAIASVAWVAVARTWVQQERSRIFDHLRLCDTDCESGDPPFMCIHSFSRLTSKISSGRIPLSAFSPRRSSFLSYFSHHSRTPSVDGQLSSEETLAALMELRPPLQRDEIEALVACIERDGKVPYAIAPTSLRCYGGGLQEIVSKGVERVLAAHAQVWVGFV